MTKAQFSAKIRLLQSKNPSNAILATFEPAGPLGHFWPNNEIAKKVAASHAAAGQEAVELENFSGLAAMCGDREGSRTPLADLRRKYYCEICSNLAEQREKLAE